MKKLLLEVKEIQEINVSEMKHLNGGIGPVVLIGFCAIGTIGTGAVVTAIKEKFSQAK